MSLEQIGPVALIGAGKMGLALARGWIAAGLPAKSLVLCDPQPGDAARQFAADNGITLVARPDNVFVHVLVLAVKPQVMFEVLETIRGSVGKHTLVISIAAGIGLKKLADALGTERIVRAMPNTPAQIGKGITGAVALSVGEADRHIAEDLLRAAGDVLWFDAEARIDGVTAVSGSGPAYVFHLVEALAAAAEQQGFAADEAMRLARATVIGAAALMDADPLPASTLRENVTSPKGTTAAALSVLMDPIVGLSPLMARAVAAARARSEELGRGA